MKCVAVLEKMNKSNKKFIIADMILNSLYEFGEEEWNNLNN